MIHNAEAFLKFCFWNAAYSLSVENTRIEAAGGVWDFKTRFARVSGPRDLGDDGSFVIEVFDAENKTGPHRLD